MPSIVPEPYVIAHIKRVTFSELDPDTGTNVIVCEPAAIRRAQSISQIGRMRGSSRQIMSIEFLKLVETSLHLAVSEPSIFGPEDQILLFPEVQDGNYIEGTGVAFFIDGYRWTQDIRPGLRSPRCSEAP